MTPEEQRVHKDFEDEGATIPDEVLAIDASSDQEVYLSPSDSMRENLEKKNVKSGSNLIESFTYVSDA